MSTNLILLVLAVVGMAVLLVIGILLLSMWTRQAKDDKGLPPNDKDQLDSPGKK